MRITEVQVRFVKPKDGLIAFASVVLNEQVYLGSIAIHEKLNGRGYRLTFPTKTLNGRSFQIFHPIVRGFGMELEAAIITKLKDVMNKGNGDAGHSRTLA